MKKSVFLALPLLFLLSCGGKNVPDVSKVDVNIEFIRFDQELEALKKDSASRTSLDGLQKKYPWFTELFFSTLARVATLSDTAAPIYIKAFLFDKDIMELHADMQKQFADFEPFK